MLSTHSQTIWAVVPAAGRGQRMDSILPKQYLSIGGKPLLLWTLERLQAVGNLAGIVVAVAPDDRLFSSLIPSRPGIKTVLGGAERAVSVRNALADLIANGAGRDWVLVHDAARPCLRPAAVRSLIERASARPDGGLLAVPVADTLKKSVDDYAAETLDRSHLWQAHTPQLFPVDTLFNALQAALERERPVTDEASAMEHSGYRPLLVEDSRDNIKITRPGDLRLAEAILLQQTERAE